MIIYQRRVHPEDLRENIDVYYLFSDNDRGSGYYNFREYTNFIGVRIKKDEHNFDTSYWSDTTYEDNVTKIISDVKHIQNEVLKIGKILVYSEQLFSFDIGEYTNRSPKTASYVQSSITSLLHTKATLTWA
jgi:hypothetical protein